MCRDLINKIQKPKGFLSSVLNLCKHISYKFQVCLLATLFPRATCCNCQAWIYFWGVGSQHWNGNFSLGQHAATFKHGSIFEVLEINIEMGILACHFYHILEHVMLFSSLREHFSCVGFSFFSLHLLQRTVVSGFIKMTNS